METEYDFKAGTYDIAKHEAGHWLCAMALGWEPRSIHIMVPEHANGHYGYALTSRREHLQSLEDVRFYAMNRVKVLYAGVNAQHFNGSVFDGDSIRADMSRGGGANTDFMKAEEIYFFYYNCLSNPKGWEDEFHPLILDVQLLIRMNYDFILAVANRMMAMASAPGEEILLTGGELTSIYHSCDVRLASFLPE